MAESVGIADTRSLTEENQQLREQVAQLQQQLDWFKRQLFGQKSEKRTIIDPAIQADMLSPSSSSEPPPVEPKETITYTRAKKQRTSDTVTDKGLRFDASVAVRVIELSPEGIGELDESEYERVSEKVTHRLAQKPADYEVVKIVRPVFKRKADQRLLCAAAAPQVLERSFADVSFVAGMLIDKFSYHLPLYRQHQRLAGSG
ncbi:MAG: IS66 family transposase, partial [Acidobacteriota bacterium]